VGVGVGMEVGVGEGVGVAVGLGVGVAVGSGVGVVVAVGSGIGEGVGVFRAKTTATTEAWTFVCRMSPTPSTIARRISPAAKSAT
jgi:hypothetical protein